MEPTTLDLSWLCIVIPVGIMIVVAILGTRSKLRYARRIREAQARGAFADLNKPENKARIRSLAFLALIGLLGMLLSIVVLILQQVNQFTTFSGITVIVAIVFGVIGSIAGFLMQREVNRRL
jgi:hypothetical protein